MVNKRLNSLRTMMSKEKIDIYYFNTSDYHLSEYTPEYFKTIKYFSNFSGSMATYLVDKDNAYLFVDGRYHLQADKECLKYGIKIIKLGNKDALDPLTFIKKNYQGQVLGLDGKRTAASFAKNLEKNVKIKSLDLYSSLIENRASLSKSPIKELAIEYTGLSRKDKLNNLINILDKKTHIINNLECIAYLLNLRGDDVIHTPVFMAYLCISDKQVYLFLNQNRLSKKLKEDLINDGLIIDDYDKYYEFLKNLHKKTITIDENKTNYETYRLIKDNNKLINERSIVEDLKAIKNEVEIANLHKAQEYDGVALVRFFKWLDESDTSKLTEYDIVQKIDNFRTSYKAFDLSFNTIAGINENAAYPHYSPSKDKPVSLKDKGIILIDSGGQYLEGTTDVTRVFCIGKVSKRLKHHFSLVLKSMLNFAYLKFPSGLSGRQLDAVCRQELWNENLDYLHGTGHGVGYVLSVHEFPPNIRLNKTGNGSEEVPLVPGHYFSDEPGLYLEGKYGLRCENMLLCVKDKENEFGQFLKFEMMTLCPFDTRLIDKKSLDEKTVKRLNDYHQEVYRRLSPYLDTEEKKFLRRKTKAI